MPELSSVKSPLSRPSNIVPDFNFGDREIQPLGELDTWLSRVTGTNYDKGFNPYKNQQDNRFENTSWLTATSNNLGSLLSKTANGVVQTAGAITSLIASPLAAQSDVSFMDVFSKNPLNTLADGIDGHINELFPRVQKSDFNSKGFLEQLGRPGELLSANIDSLAFLATSFVGAGMLSKLNVGTKLANKLAKVNPSYKYLAEIAGPNKAGMADKINFFATNELLTFNEAAMEAKDAKESLSLTLRQKRDLGEVNYTDEEIEAKSDQAGLNTFWLNALTLSVTNGAFTKLVTPVKANVSNKLNPWDLRHLDNEFKAPVYSSKFERFLADKGYTPGVVTKALVGNVISEGLEESMQYSVQKINGTDGISFVDSASKYISDIATMEIANMSDPERAKAAGLGALIGGLGVVGAGGLGLRNKNIGPANEARAFRTGQQAAIKELNDSYAGFTSLNRFKDQEGKLYVTDDKYVHEVGGKPTPVTKEEFTALAAEKGVDPAKGGTYSIPGELSFDDDGNPNISAEALHDLVKDTKVQGELDDLVEKELASSKPDQTKLRLYKMERLKTAAIAAHKAGVMDIFQEQLETLSTDTALALNSDISAKEELDLAKDYVNRLNSALLTVDNSLLEDGAKRVAYDKIGRVISLDYAGQVEQAKIQDLSEGLSEEQQGLGYALSKQLSILDEADASYREAAYSKDAKENFDKALSELNLDEIANAPSKIKDYARSITNLNYIIQAREELGRTVDTILSGGKEKITTPFEAGGLPFKAPTSAKEYEFYESRVTKKLSYDDKVNDIMTQYNSGLFNELESFLNITDPVEGAVELSNFVKSSIERNVVFSDDVKESIAAKIDTLKGEVAKLEALVREPIEAEGYKLEEMFQEAADAYLDEDIADAFKLLTELKAALAPLNDFSIDQLPTRELKAITPKYILERLMEPAKTLIASAYVGEEINPAFTDEASIDVEIKKLQAINDNVLPTRDDLKGLGLPQVLKQLITLKADYEALKKDREAKNAKQDAMYAGFVLGASREPTIASTLSEEDRELIEEVAKDDVVTASLIASDRIVDKESIRLRQDALDTDLAVLLDKLGVRGATGLISMMKHNPLRGLSGIIARLQFINAVGGSNVEAFTNFTINYDLVDLMEAEVSPDYNALRDIFGKYFGLWEIATAQNTDLSTKQALLNYQKFLNVKPITPTSAQFRTSLQIARILNSPKESVDGRVQVYQNIALLKAPAGAGKTSVVLPLATQLSGLEAGAIYTAAPYAPGAKAIATSTSTAPKTVTELVEDLNNDNISEDVKVIVVDEITTLSYDALHALAGAFTAFLNRNQERSIKLVGMYDPLQVNESDNGVPVLDREFYSKGTGYDTASADQKKLMEEGQSEVRGTLPFIHNVTDVSPLATTFRSNVASVIDLQNLFKGTAKVESPATTASSNPNNTTKDILGAYSGSSTEIIKVLKSSYATNNGATTRTRVIITDNVNKWQPLLDQQGIVGVDVITVEQSSGITRDEVYIDIKVENKPSFNRRMYTAISRASKFVYLGNYPTNFTEDPSIPDKVKKAEELNTSRNDTTKDLVKAQLAFFGVESTVDIPTPTTETVVAEETETPVDVPFDIEDTPSAENSGEPTLPIPPEVITLGEGTHELSFPSHTAFNTYGKLGPIKAGDEVMIVRDDSQQKNRYLVVQPNPDNEDYRVVGIFSDEEVPRAEAALGLQGELEKLVPYTFIEELTDINNTNTFMRVKGNVALSSAYTLQVSGNSVDMKFHYDNVPTTLTEANAGQVVLKALEDMYPDLVGIENADEIRSNPTSFVRYQVFSTETSARKGLRIDDVEDLLNVPLMVISGVKTERGKELRPIYIRLNSQVLNDKNTKAVDIAPVREFVKKLAELEELIKIAKFPSAIYNQFSSTFSFNIGETNVYFPFHKFIRAIANPTATSKDSSKVGKAIIASDDLNKKLKEAKLPLLEPIDVSTLDPKLVQLVKDIDKLIHGSGTYKGEAQVALNKLATANFLVELPGGKTLVLRDYKPLAGQTLKEGKLSQDFELVGPSLLGQVTFEHTKGKSRNALIPKLLIAKMEKYLKKAYDKYAGVQSKLSELPFLVKESDMPKRHKDLADMLIEKDTAHLFPLTLSDIDQLVNKGVDKSGDFTNINQGFGLRTPISRKAFGKSAEGVQDIEGLFETTFQGITRTRIGVTFEGGSIQKNAEIAKTERIPNPYVPFYRAVDSAKSLEEALALAPQFATLEFNVSIDEAIAMRYDEVNKASTYLTVSHKIKDLLIRVRDKSLSLKDKLINSLEASSTAIDFGDKYAARDFVRATIYAEIMPEVYNTDPYAILNLSRMWVEKKYDTIYDRVEPFTDRAMELQKIYAEIFEEAGIPFETSTNPVEFVENVVVASTEFRAKQKKGFKLATATPKQVDAFELFLTGLDEAIDGGTASMEEFIELNKENFDKFVELTGIKDTNLETVLYAIDAAREELGVERSMRRTEGADIGDLINEEGAIEVYNSFFNVKTLANIFKKKTTEAFHVITEAYMQFQLGKENWGLFKDGVVYVTKDSNNKVGSKVVRHEAFHKVFWNYLTKDEQVRALALAEERYGKNTKLELEERLADDFAGFKATGKTWANALKTIFRKILRFFNFTYNNLNSLEQFFTSINEGYYSTRKPSEVNVERDLKIAKYWKSVDLFTLAKTLFLDTFVQLRDESRNTSDKEAPFRTFDSAIEETYEILKQWYKTGDFPLDGDPEYTRKAIEPLVSNPKAYAEFIDQYFSNANAKAAKRQRIAELDVEKKALQDSLAELDEELKTLDETSEEFSAKNSDRDEIGSEYESLLAQELFETELRNPEEKLTGMVKARLIGIKYNDAGKTVYAPLSSTYGAMLSFVNQADASSMSNLLNSLQDRVKYYFDGNSVKTKGLYNTVRKASASYLVNLIQDIRENKAPKNLNFFRDVSSLNEYAIFGKNGEDTSNITHTEALRYPDKYIKIEREINDSASVFGQKLLEKTGMSMDEIKQAYRLFEDVNFIRSLTAAAVSMRKMKPYVGSSRWDFYNWVNRYTQMGRNGQAAAIETRFVERFADYVQKNGTPFNTDFMDRLANANTPETKLIVFNKLFRTIGMGPVSSQLGNAQVEEAFSRLKNSVAGINEELKAGNPYEVIDNQGSLVSTIVELFENSASLIDISSYIRGDGKKGYGWSDASLQSSLLNYFDKMLGGKPQDTVKPNHVKVETVNGKKVITSTSPFLKSNPFITGKNKLRSFVDHDSLKKLNNTTDATFLYGEGLVHYHNRNFVFGFLNRLRTSRDGYYFQFLPVPANRTSMQGVEVGALQIDAAKKVLTDMIENEKNRPNLPELANNKNYQKNKDKFFIPGLSGKVTDISTKDALAQIDKHIATEVETVVKEMMGLTGARKVDMDPADVANGLKFFNIKIDKYKSTADFKKEIAKLVKDKAAEKDIEAKKAEAQEMETKVMTALVTAFYYNSIVNQYSLSQIIYGDNAFYTSKEDLTKRIQVFTATGDTFLVDDRFGLPKTTRIAILQDVVRVVPTDMEGVRADSYRDDIKETDGEGFMLPEFYELLARTQGIESNTDVVMKLVYAGMDEKGIPSAVKYSVKVLTDQLVEDYPHLRKLREQMRAEGIEQATFISSVKTATPENAAEMKDDGIYFNGKEGFGDSVLVLDSKNLRSQLNPAKSIDTSVANPSQVTSMMNTNGLNTVEAQRLYELNSLVMELGGKIIGRQLRMSEKGGLTKGSLAALRKRLIRITDGVPNGQDINYLLSYVSPDKERISMNLPIIQQKVLATIASMYSTATTAFRFSGSKMVLQSEFGTYSAVASALQYKDAEGYTEVLLPEAYRALFKEGDVVGGKNSMMAFRIPSTNYHSALALKVKGFYKTPIGAESNVIIAPSMIVYYHGSDCLIVVRVKFL